jgi:hypothetical protein
MLAKGDPTFGTQKTMQNVLSVMPTAMLDLMTLSIKFYAGLTKEIMELELLAVLPNLKPMPALILRHTNETLNVNPVTTPTRKVLFGNNN